MRSTLCMRVCALAAVVAAGAIVVACSDSNEPATQDSNDETDGSGGSESDDAGAATGGAEAAGGAQGTGGATGIGGQGGAFVCDYPLASNPPPTDAPECTGGEAKNDPCTAEQEGYRCYKNCGPRHSSGWKPLTCTSGVFTEISDCTWTGTDYSAFRIPALTAIDPTCPADPPQATTACNVEPCISCAASNGAYRDSSGTEKSGWCTCYHDPDGSDPVWTCGTAGKAWPCPGAPANPGC